MHCLTLVVIFEDFSAHFILHSKTGIMTILGCKLGILYTYLVLLCINANKIHEKLFNSYENALDVKLFTDVLKEANAVFDNPSVTKKTLAHGKKPTFWFDLYGGKPRTKIEEAILQLSQLPESHTIQGLSTDINKKIVGAEWWIQRKRCNEGIQFHYDKDEVWRRRKVA